MLTIYYLDDDTDDLEVFSSAVRIYNTKLPVSIQSHTFIESALMLDAIKAHEGGTSVILLDINMPRKSGFDVLKELSKEQESNNHIIIMFSTGNNNSAIETSRVLGASGYAIKPNDFQQLQNFIKKILVISSGEITSGCDFVIRY